jgi:hypothetical protein
MDWYILLMIGLLMGLALSPERSPPKPPHVTIIVDEVRHAGSGSVLLGLFIFGALVLLLITSS